MPSGENRKQKQRVIEAAEKQSQMRILHLCQKIEKKRERTILDGRSYTLKG